MDAAIIRECTEKLGAQIRKRRIEQGLTQARLGMMIGNGQSYIYRVESGKICVGIDTLVKIAEALGVAVRDLIVF